MTLLAVLLRADEPPLRSEEPPPCAKLNVPAISRLTAYLLNRST